MAMGVKPANRPELCPMGCGRTTEDAYGGPCKACWDATTDDDGDLNDELYERYPDWGWPGAGASQ